MGQVKLCVETMYREEYEYRVSLVSEYVNINTAFENKSRLLPKKISGGLEPTVPN